MPIQPDLLMLPIATALRILRDHDVQADVRVTQPRSKKFPLLDDHLVIRVSWTAPRMCTLVVAAKMGKEVR